MNNYVYIIASLPKLESENPAAEGLNPQTVINEIKSLCKGSDVRLIDELLSGFEGSVLNADFYRKMRSSKSPFLKAWFEYDRQVRNTKVEYLNRTLGRHPGTDLILMDGEKTVEFEGKEKVEAVLNGNDIISRERGIDNLMWERIEDLNRSELFNMNVILGAVAKLSIIDRWLKLDPETGREMFRRLVQEIKKTSTI